MLVSKTPQPSNVVPPRTQKLYSNFFKIQADPKAVVTCFSLEIEPELAPGDPLIPLILKAAQPSLQKHSIHAVLLDRAIYLPGDKVSVELPSTTVVIDSQPFEVTPQFECVYQLHANVDLHYRLLQKHLQQMIRVLKLQRIDYNWFNPMLAQEKQVMGLSLWPGYAVRVSRVQAGLFVQIQPKIEVVRTEKTLLDEFLQIKEVNESRGVDYVQDMSDYIIGQTIITKYNNRTYKVQDLRFDLSCQHRFEADKKKVSIAEYMQERYGLIVQNPGQPLIQVGENTFLLPEFCLALGMTERLNEQKKIFREVAMAKNADAPIKIKEAATLVRQVMSDAKCIQRMREWRFFVEQQPHACEGKLFQAGNILMGHQTEKTVEKSINSHAEQIGQRITFAVDEVGNDLGINLTRNKMFEQPTINKWGIFYNVRHLKQAQQLVNQMEKTLAQFDYQAKPMAMFPIQGANVEIWRQEIASKLRQDVQVVILLLPGGKDGSDLYPDLKRMLLEEIPVISQIVLTGTINYGKNLKSIVAKIITQICAKIGGVPWCIENLPFSDKRTMICGMKTYHDFKHQSVSVFGFVASYNRTATKYWSTTRLQADFGDELCQSVPQCLQEAIKHFAEVNRALPERVIVYRDEINKYKQLAQVEVELLKQVTDSIEAELAYVTVRPRPTQVELYAQGFFEDSFKNAIPGTVLDSGITVAGQSDAGLLNEFYMLCSSAKFGISLPTRCTIFFSGIANSIDGLQSLTYKLCHTYFNKASALRVPSPILYAQKLAQQVCQRSILLTNNEQQQFARLAPLHTHSYLRERAPGLYFL